MNNSKRGLILASGIIVLVYAFIGFIRGICFFTVDLYQATDEFASAIMVGGLALMMLAAFAVVGGVLLIVCVANPEEFKNRQALYITGSVFAIIASGAIGIPAILLYISFGLKNEAQVVAALVQPAAPMQNVVARPVQSNAVKERIAMLREMKEKGDITEEQYKELVFELIKK